MSDEGNVSKRAVILAGGRGTRLRPYTVVLPKPLMPIGEYPILELIIKQLAGHGFSHVTLAVNHQADIIKAYFADGSRFGIAIDYSLENVPLSTMGPLKLIDGLPENFLVMNGDILTDIDYGAFYEEHCRRQSLFTISSYRREQKIDYGVLETNDKGDLVGFREKPGMTYEVSMGIYMLNRKVLDTIPSGTPYGFDSLMQDLIRAGQYPYVRSFSGYWLDIGRPDDYMLAIDEFEKMQTRFLGG